MCPRQTRGVCCVHVSGVRGRSTAKLTYVHNAAWPGTGNGSALAQYSVAWRPDTCFLRIDLLTLQLAETDGNCVHDRWVKSPSIRAGNKPSRSWKY